MMDQDCLDDRVFLDCNEVSFLRLLLSQGPCGRSQSQYWWIFIETSTPQVLTKYQLQTTSPSFQEKLNINPPVVGQATPASNRWSGLKIRAFPNGGLMVRPCCARGLRWAPGVHWVLCSRA